MASSRNAALAMAGPADGNVRSHQAAVRTGFTRNPGRCPPRAAGKRVVVQLANGTIHGREPVGAGTPTGWAADGRGGCDWRHSDSPYAIAGFKIL